MAPKMLMVAVLAILAAATVTDAQETCAQSLIPCAPYLTNTSAPPQDDCCNPIREAVRTQFTCLCSLFNDPTLLNSFNVSVPDALRIARDCGVNANLSDCNNATSPTSAPPPPGQRGDNGGEDRTALTGITALLLVLVSIALY
ncbi:Translationally-controlled tumor protein [Hibiscus syriacus]|uniref:Translationally-controlled tumor protein n=1 Tax=Hibiscus syriacus TaxID=106335 RepID=A0A6A2XNM9_HIBSY|nr:non-specific lipid transfer protein GPI-anchored 8-like isoform X2 [Hibiscus syriacus]KAE8678031.1 Translationally-controlled tumor protein [Hibiscus syriacus]